MQIDGDSTKLLWQILKRPGCDIGSPLGARGCIVPLSSSGSGELWVRVSVAWIGVLPQPVLACGANDMGDEAYRRVVFRDVAVR